MKLIIAFFFTMLSFYGCAGRGTTNHVSEKDLKSFYELDYSDQSSSIIFHIARGPNVGKVDVSVDGKKVGHLNQKENLLCAVILKSGEHRVTLSTGLKLKTFIVNVNDSSKFLVNIQSRNFVDKSLDLLILDPALIRGAKLYQVTDLR